MYNFLELHFIKRSKEYDYATKVVTIEVDPYEYETMTIPNACHFGRYKVTERNAAICQLLDTFISEYEFSLFVSRMERFLEKEKITATNLVNAKTNTKTLIIEHLLNSEASHALVCGVSTIKEIYDIFQTSSSSLPDFILEQCEHRRLYCNNSGVYEYGQPQDIKFIDDSNSNNTDNVLMRDMSNDVVISCLTYVRRNKSKLENVTNGPSKNIPYDAIVFKFYPSIWLHRSL